MATPTKNTPGNVVDVPKPEPKIKWVDSTEAKTFERFLNKNFIPKDDEAFAKKFFVRPISIIPYSPADASSSASQTLYKFLCQKYHKNKLKQISVSDGRGGRENIEDNEAVEGHRMIDAGRMGEGTFECVDPTACFTIDARDFKEQYQADNAD